MNVRVSAAGACFVVVAIVGACSSKPNQPPIETTGPSIPTPGIGTVVADAGAEDSGIDSAIPPPVDAGNEAAACLTGTCGGCCTPTGVCEPGTTSAVCGISGLGCTACGSLQSCINGACQ